MANPLARMETSQEFGSGATDGIRANPDRNSGMGYYVWLYGNYQPFGHAGKDLKAEIGTPIYAIDDGTVLYAGWAEDLPGSGPVRQWLFYYNFGGILTVIQHSWGISAIAHQSSNDEIEVGQRVKAGQLIGKSGNTKTRTETVEPHVHIEALVYMDYRTDVSRGIVYGRVDPTPYFGYQGIAAQAGTITPLAVEEDDMFNDDDRAALIAARNEATNAKNNAADARQVATDARNEATNAKNFALAAIQSTASLLQTRLPDPQNPDRSYSLAEWIVYGNLKAGGAQQIASNLTPDLIAAAVAKASSGVDAQAIADRLQVTVKEGK